MPLGSRAVTGIVVACDVALPAGVTEQSVKPVTRIMDDAPFIPSDVVSLAQWTAEYYAAGAGETITAVLPPKTRDERADAHKTRRVVAITVAGLSVLDRQTSSRHASAAAETDDARRLTAKQREALEILQGSPDGLPTATLSARDVGADLLGRLAKAGLVAFRQERVERDPFEASPFRGGAV